MPTVPLDFARPFAAMAGSTAVVTGAARGLGLEIARTLQSAAGMAILLVDRDAAELDRAVTELATAGTVAGVATSLSTDDCRAPIERALSELPPVSVWVNNAGRVSHQGAEDVDLDVFEEVFRDNTSSALRGSQLAYRAMRSHDRGGAIVNITSLVTEKALPQRLSYSTSKAGLENVTRACAQEWGPCGIRVNAVSPGYIETRLTQWAEDDPRAVAKQQTLSQLALRRAGSPEDIATTVLYLASPLAGYVTGQTVFVDGGWHLS
ncbi:SDR family NAD(P)-dependent oxidoreductase [Nakamurella leprariae]|uniref:SDR family oxidoreductase n=1 Tax=Nakamurella leprariae TaxID=2803911 RepID=A0A938YI39_9ACTN|nr:SDR family oxidoreductase [Nakamurella leprariae]MBM9468742.1 SDR family oxidoreductase [Nakamurella leprariae]